LNKKADSETGICEIQHTSIHIKKQVEGAHGGRPGGTTIFTQEEEVTLKAYVVTRAAVIR